MSASVLILTRDAGPGFAATLAALAAQSPPADELLIVDSGSSDGTLERAREAGARIHRIPVEEFDFGRTRDLGYSLARGALVANLSQDVVPKDATWLARHTACFADPLVAGSSARCEARDPERMFLWQRMGRFYTTRELRRFAARYGTPVSNANSCIRRSAWEQLPHQAMPIAEDLLFQKRAIEAGYRIAWIEEATAWHQHRFTLAQAFKRAYNEGMAARILEVPYGPLDALRDVLAPGDWLRLSRQLRYGRVHGLLDLIYPLLRPAAVLLGHRRGRRYWR